MDSTRLKARRGQEEAGTDQAHDRLAQEDTAGDKVLGSTAGDKQDAAFAIYNISDDEDSDDSDTLTCHYTDEDMRTPAPGELRPENYNFEKLKQFQDRHELATLEFLLVSESLRIFGEGISDFDETIHKLILLPAPPLEKFSTTYMGYLELGQNAHGGRKSYTPRPGDLIEISFDLAEAWNSTGTDRTSLAWPAKICKSSNVKAPGQWLPCLLKRPWDGVGVYNSEPKITGTLGMEKKRLEAILRESTGQPVRARLVERANPLSNVKRTIGRMVNSTRLDPFMSWNTRINKLILGTHLNKLDEEDFFACISQELGPDMLKLVNLDSNQVAALEMARKSLGGAAFIQGPPGTGKSHVIKQVASLCLLCEQSQPQLVICCPNNLTADALAEDIHAHISTSLEGAPRQKYVVRIYADAAEQQYLNLRCYTSSDTSSSSEHSGNPRPDHSRDDVEENLASLSEVSRGIASAILEAEKQTTQGVDDPRFTLPELSCAYYMLESVGLIADQPAWPGFEETNRDFIQLQQMKSGGKSLNIPQSGRLREASQELRQAILRNASVIVSTTANIAAPRTIAAIEPTTTNLIFEENTRELEVNLIPIFAARFRRDPKLLVIGDQFQLSPQALVPVAELTFARQYELSFMTRMVSIGHACAILTTNYRMASDIAEPINRFIYGGRLSNHRSVDLDCRPLQILFQEFSKQNYQLDNCNAIWLDTRPGEKNITNVDSITRSRKNEFHVGLTLQVAKKLLNLNVGSGRQPRVVIITMYENQKSLYLQAMSQMQVLGAVHVENLGTVNTDGAQGLEWDFVIVDLSLSDQPGFAADWRRLNVAFSRARDGLVVIGNRELISRMKGAQVLKNFLNHYIKNQRICAVKADEWYASEFFTPTESESLVHRPARR